VISFVNAKYSDRRCYHSPKNIIHVIGNVTYIYIDKYIQPEIGAQPAGKGLHIQHFNLHYVIFEAVCCDPGDGQAYEANKNQYP
jgi:hypothetical protein